MVRKHLGYAHIPQNFAQEVNAFCREHLNPYVNFHRPCFFPKTVTDAKGKERKSYRYEDMKTPFEKFKSLSCPESCLKPGITMAQLEKIALSKT
ncbi:integrase, catalytic region, partial [mine drainage metagenome]